MLDLIVGTIVGATSKPSTAAGTRAASYGAVSRSGEGQELATATEYKNPLTAVHGLAAGRIDMGVDYAGSGRLLALGNGTVTMASNSDTGPPSCYGRSCWPVGGIVVYRLSDGPFAGKYVYAAENITATVKAGEKVSAGQQIAIVHTGYPDWEIGWAAGRGAEALAIANGHEYHNGDPGNWSTIEGRNFDELLIALGAPSGDLQPNAPDQNMPAGWPSVPAPDGKAPPPRAKAPLSQGSPARSQ